MTAVPRQKNVCSAMVSGRAVMNVVEVKLYIKDSRIHPEACLVIFPQYEEIRMDKKSLSFTLLIKVSVGIKKIPIMWGTIAMHKPVMYIQVTVTAAKTNKGIFHFFRCRSPI